MQQAVAAASGVRRAVRIRTLAKAKFAMSATTAITDGSQVTTIFVPFDKMSCLKFHMHIELI